MKIKGFQAIQTFYVINTIGLLWLCRGFYDGGHSSNFTAHYLERDWIVPLLSILLMGAVIFLFQFLKYQFVRVLWFFLNFVIIGFDFQHSPGHSYHLFIWIALFLSFIQGPIDSKTDPQRILPIVRACQLQILLIYSLAGVWKLVSLFKSFGDPNLVFGPEYLAYVLSHEYMNSKTVAPISDFLTRQTFFSSIVSIGVIIVQLLSIPIVFFPQWYGFWGIVLCFFHLGTLASVNVFFLWPIPIILVFLCSYQMEIES